MAERQYHTLTKRTVDRLSVNGKDAVFWDNELPGFGVRVYPSGKKVFVVQTRAFGRSKRVSLGTHGDTDFSVDHARRKATDVIARIKDGAAAGSDPETRARADRRRSRRALPARVCRDALQARHHLALPPHAAQAYRAGSRRTLRVAEVEYKDILAFHNSLHQMPTVANRAADILVKMFNLADAMGLASFRRQPVPGRAPLPGRETRAVPDPRGAVPARRGAAGGPGKAARLRPTRRRPSGFSC